MCNTSFGSLRQEIFKSGSGKKIFSEFLSTVRNFAMLDDSESGVLVAFSGGSDSVLLLLALLEYKHLYSHGLNIVACHVNHMIRGDEAQRDESFSVDFCSALGVELLVECVDVPTLSKKLGIGIEEAARNARYESFSRIIENRDDISCVATAHNASDNCETIIYNIARGASARGASGIPPVRDNIIRPLIEVTKKEIVDFLIESQIPYIHDSTNDSDEYTRNYIRHHIMPELCRINISYEKAFSDFAESLRMDNAYLDGVAESFLSSYSGFPTAEDLRSLESPILSRVLGILASRNGAALERVHINTISEMLRKSDNFAISVIGAVFRVERGECSFVQAFSDLPKLSQRLLTGYNQLEAFDGAIIVNNIHGDSSTNVYKFSISVNISSDIIEGDLSVRFKQDGDSYRYGGMTHKLKKVFNDLGIPPSIRSRIPVITDEKGILWVPGLPPRDADVKADKNNTTTLTFVVTDNGFEPIYPARKYDIKKGKENT